MIKDLIANQDLVDILCLFLNFITFAQNVKLGIWTGALHSFATFISSLVFLCIYSKQFVAVSVSLATKTSQNICHQYVCQHPDTTEGTFFCGHHQGFISAEQFITLLK